MISPATSFPELLEFVKRKFGLLCWGSGEGAGGGGGESDARSGDLGFKLKIKDEEGDMVTMGDQEDLDMAILACRDVAATAEGDGEFPVMGKMEVRTTPPPYLPSLPLKTFADIVVDMGSRDLNVYSSFANTSLAGYGRAGQSMAG